MADGRARELRLTERRARQLQHVVVEVESDALLGVRREQLEDPAGPGADVEQPPDRALADEHVQHRALDGGLTDIQVAQPSSSSAWALRYAMAASIRAWRTRDSAARSAAIVTSVGARVTRPLRQLGLGAVLGQAVVDERALGARSRMPASTSSRRWRLVRG